MMTSFGLARLVGRKLIRIKGPDCYPYLQGLICNDLRYLYEAGRVPQRKHAIPSRNALSTFVLNPQGRAICDMILYRTPKTRDECSFTPPGSATEYDEILIECDSTLASGLANTLYAYRVRRKVEVALEGESSVWCLFPLFKSSARNETDLVNMSSLVTQERIADDMIVVNDPRLTAMGLRVISVGEDSQKVRRDLQNMIGSDIQEVSTKAYTTQRLILGVGEGVGDHPESNCFPLECNADFLGSVSFNKGCYLGQELTARIYFTGVVRKRLMPVKLDLKSTSKELGILPLVPGSNIIDANTRAIIGSLRHVTGDRALALLRYNKVNKSNLIHEGSNTVITANKPYWWELIGEDNR